jgi:hypothetical protein
MNLIAICHRCPNRQKDCAGPCVCTVDGEDIIEHAETRYCPEGRYRLGLGDIMAMALARTGVAAVYRWLTGKRGKPCGGCQKRQQRLNQSASSATQAAPTSRT